MVATHDRPFFMWPLAYAITHQGRRKLGVVAYMAKGHAVTIDTRDANHVWQTNRDAINVQLFIAKSRQTDGHARASAKSSAKAVN